MEVEVDSIAVFDCEEDDGRGLCLLIHRLAMVTENRRRNFFGFLIDCYYKSFRELRV